MAVENIEAEKKIGFFKGVFLFWWNLIAEKGKIATLVGLILAVPVDLIIIYEFLSTRIVPDTKGLYFLVVVNFIGMFWFILPSRFTIKSPTLEILVED